MTKVMAVLTWPVRKIWNLRALVQDEDHDAWLDSHRSRSTRRPPTPAGSSAAGPAAARRGGSLSRSARSGLRGRAT